MTTRPRLLLVGSVPPPFHGSTVYFEGLLNSEITEQFDIRHLDTSDHRDLSNLGRLDFVNVYLGIKNAFQLLIALLKTKPDLVYFSPSASTLPYLRDGLFILITSWFSKAKIVIHLHGGSYFRDEFYAKSNPVVRYFIRYSLTSVHTAIVLGESLRSTFLGLVENLAVLPNGVNFTSQVLKDRPTKGGRLRVGYLGNLLESKGVIDLLMAADIVVKNYPGVVFEIAGAWWDLEPDTRPRCLHYITENRLSQNVRLLGSLLGTNKEEFLLGCDIFVFPSWYRYEGLPLVILEAMAAGCPVISTRGVGAISEVVIDGETGILVEPQKPDCIAAAVQKLIENPGLRLKMGAAGRTRFEQEYTLEKNVAGLMKILDETLE